MKRILFIAALLFTFCAQAQIDKFIPSKPPVSEGLVHDYANILTPEQESSLNQKLIDYDDSTSNQVVIVTLPTLSDPKSGNVYEDEEVGLAILRDWGVGQKGKNNGVVILVVKSPDDKEKKVRIEVGYGLEGAIPDVTAVTIIDTRIIPQFKEKNYYRGLDEAVDDIIKAASGEYKAPEGYGKKKGKGISLIWIIIIIFIVFSIAGSGGGKNKGGMVSRRGFGGFGTGWIIGSLMGGGWGSGGGGSGGGWSGGGGGGFGGFGGGSGGGGGASGSW